MSSKPAEQIITITVDPQIAFLLERILRSAGYQVHNAGDPYSADLLIRTTTPALVILNENLAGADSRDLARNLLEHFPSIPLLLLVNQVTPDFMNFALNIGITDTLCLPLHPDDILKAVQNSLSRSQKRKQWVMQEAKHVTSSLQHRVDELELLARLGRSINSSLDLESILGVVVTAAVQLTGAEESTLLLVDEQTDELYMRAAHNFPEESIRTFRMPVIDSLPGGVVKTGQPVLLNQESPSQIKPSYLVYNLIYVPLKTEEKVFGVLGVDNRHNHLAFTEHHQTLLSTIADYTVIAIENARLYADTALERNKLETILTRIHDGVIVIDLEGCVVLINQTAREALGLEEKDPVGKPALSIFTQPELQGLIKAPGANPYQWIEINVDDGRTFNGNMASIPGVGWAITINDITSLKRLDRIKSEFVGTVSHDLRSPLTSILGYIELIDRVGPVNDTQREFISRVQASVHSITSLVDDLLNLGRIEAGIDTRKELIHLAQIINLSCSSFMTRAAEKNITLSVNIPEKLPSLYGNPVQVRQIIDNLVDNAVKYTLDNGTVTIQGHVEQNQIILQISDTGMGIPAVDLPYIFDKFYRASNVPIDIGGTGLGLAIVKSVIETHQGRIWVDSIAGSGSKFTIVLPILEE